MQLKALLKYALVTTVLLSVISCKEDKPLKSEDKIVLSFKKEGVLTINKAVTDSIVKTLDIEIADNEYETQTGLMYRTKLEANRGMLFIFPDVQMRSFYMKNTKIPLDIIYIDKNKTIISFQKNAQPFDETALPSDAPAKYVLEINGGFSDEWQLEIGDHIDFDVLK
ncbi:DUF192 domain-containing protein [Winogradskyella sp. UBA3174]|uniref:DUF192 domain-containing protein n=1 Tax=Winogradskyella sp. UBA3174 TaxID=1947785 RepID=UPI0025E3CE8E|nr:DUF192 domain-containing protein [Winogradskyella sp. UBA3174]|tara:strand:+ start:5885 stop:6385 length:501 start_codon:yes stop_codon:yes gene_type:complete